MNNNKNKKYSGKNIKMPKQDAQSIIPKSLAFHKQNYILVGISLCIIILGFIIMSIDKTTFGFGFLGLTLGPIILLLGFLTIIVAILYNPNKSKS